MTELAGQFRHKKHLATGQLTMQGGDVRLKGGVETDFPADGGKVMPAGACVVKKTADGLYYLANDAANGDRNAAASVTSAEKPDDDWKDKTLTWTLYLPDGTTESGTVAAAGGDENSIAAWITLLEGDDDFTDRFTAADSGAGDLLVITTKRKGRVGMKISMDLDTAFANDDGDSSSDEDFGTEADYRITDAQRSLVDMNGAARDSDPVPTLLRGHFNESEILGLTAEAKAAFIGRGSIFE